MNDVQRDQVLIEISSSVGELNGYVTRLQTHVEGLSNRIHDMKDTVVGAMAKLSEHTDRITLIERDLASHFAWRAKLGGVWIAISIGAVVIATVVGLTVSLLK